MSSPIVILSDVDGCLVHSKSDGPCRQIGVNNSGKAAFVTPSQEAFLRTMLQLGMLVPVTARSLKGFNLLDLGHDGWSITGHGVSIRQPGGELEPGWRSYIEEIASVHVWFFDEFMRLCTDLFGGIDGVGVPRIVFDDDLPFMVKVDGRWRQEQYGWLIQQLNEAVPNGWVVRAYNSCLELHPPYIGKRKATQWFLENVVPERQFTIGIGDEGTDLAFAGLCDYFLTPTKSTVFKQLKELHQVD